MKNWDFWNIYSILHSSFLFLIFFIFDIRLQSEILKLTAELSQLTALNNSLGRKYQTIHQDLIGTQSSAQGYRDDASRLVREVTLLRDELVVLRERVSSVIVMYLLRTRF